MTNAALPGPGPATSAPSQPPRLAVAPPPPPPRPRSGVARLVESPPWEFSLALCTLVAVFGLPLHAILRPAGLQGPAYTAAIVALLAVFLLDWCLRIACYRGEYLRSLFFWVDGVASLSLVLELPALVHGLALPNPRILRMSVYVTRLARLARQSRSMLRARDWLFRRRRHDGAGNAESQAAQLQHTLDLRFNTLVALFVMAALLLIPVRDLLEGHDDLQAGLHRLVTASDPALAQAQAVVLRADPRVLLLGPGATQAQAREVGLARGLAGYEIGRYQEGAQVLWVSHRAERIAAAELDVFLALFIVLVMATMSAAFRRETDRVLIEPLRQLKRSVEDAVARNEALQFLSSIRDAEPVTFLQRVFIPLVERLMAAVNVEARDSILNADEAAGPQTHAREWAVALTDMQGFTHLMETLGTDGFTAINAYFRQCAAVVARHGGDLFEHTGDGFIVTLGGQGKETRAFAMAVELVLEMEKTVATDEWRRLLAHPAWADGPLRFVRTRIGLHTGTVTTGRIGNDRIYRYGLIGEAANVASRLESANKQFGTWLLATGEVARHAPEALVPRTRRIDRVQVVGTQRPVELFTYDFSPPAAYGAFRRAFDAGVERYLAGDWPTASARFAEALKHWPEDSVTQALVARLAKLGPAAPDHWHGAFKLAQK